VEVNGPSHYFAGSHNRDKIGATRLKEHHLALLGYQLATVPYWDWDKLDYQENSKVENQTAYLQNKLVGLQVPAVAAADEANKSLNNTSLNTSVQEIEMSMADTPVKGVSAYDTTPPQENADKHVCGFPDSSEAVIDAKSSHVLR